MEERPDIEQVRRQATYTSRQRQRIAELDRERRAAEQRSSELGVEVKLNRQRIADLEAALQNKCHDLPTEDHEKFKDGCDDYQRDQLGSCRTDEMKQRIATLEERVREIAERTSYEECDCRCCQLVNRIATRKDGA